VWGEVLYFCGDCFVVTGKRVPICVEFCVGGLLSSTVGEVADYLNNGDATGCMLREGISRSVGDCVIKVMGVVHVGGIGGL
jgi:hypothetical protein